MAILRPIPIPIPNTIPVSQDTMIIITMAGFIITLMHCNCVTVINDSVHSRKYRSYADI